MNIAKGECGCKVSIAGDIYFCPLHKSAPRLYEALKYITSGKREDGEYDKFDARGFMRIAEDALAKAEGGK